MEECPKRQKATPDAPTAAGGSPHHPLQNHYSLLWSSSDIRHQCLYSSYYDSIVRRGEGIIPES